MKRSLLSAVLIILSLTSASPSAAQDFDGEALVREINEALRSRGYADVDVRNERNETTGPMTTAADTVASGTVASTASTDAQEEVDRAVAAIDGAGVRLAQRLCGAKSRPATVMMSLTASFDFVFGVETGTEVTWDVDKLCERLGMQG